MTRNHHLLELKIQAVPKEVVEDFITWADEDLTENYDSISNSFMKEFNLGYEECFELLKSHLNYENVQDSLIVFMMSSLENPDSYLDDFE